MAGMPMIGGGKRELPQSNFARSRMQVFSLLSACKWIIFLGLLFSAILYLPDQIRELYRIAYANRTFTDLADIHLGVISMSLLLGAGAMVIAAAGLIRIGDPGSYALATARMLPPTLAALPLIACGFGHLLARPGKTAEAAQWVETVGSPWEKYDLLLTKDVGSGLTVSAIVMLALALGLVVAAWKYGKNFSLLRLERLVRYFESWRFLALTTVLIAALTALLLRYLLTISAALGVFGLLAVFAICITAATTHLSLLTIKYEFPFLPTMFAFAVLWSVFDLNDNHAVQVVDSSLATGASTKPPPQLADQFLKWYQSRTNLGDFKDEYPVYVVAAQGGGIYAAYQTALFLARLQDLCPSFRDHLFAISSVSGGSLGAAAFIAALEPKFAPTPASSSGLIEAKFEPCPVISQHLDPKLGASGDHLDKPGEIESRVRKILSNDFLSPLVAATLFPDFTQRFLFFRVPLFDRARALEQAFAGAVADAIGDRANPVTQSFLAGWSERGSNPALLINATDAASGRRVIIAPFELAPSTQFGASSRAFSQYPFWSAPSQIVETHSNTGFARAPEISLGTAASISARFPWVTPAASVLLEDAKTGTQKKIRLVDGGYVDNSGVETALDLMEELKPTLDMIRDNARRQAPVEGNEPALYRPVRIHLIMLSGGDFPARTAFGLGELMEPIRALLSTRQSRAYVAIERASRSLLNFTIATYTRGDKTSAVSVGGPSRVLLENPFYELPLGWRISERSRDIIARQSGAFRDCAPDEQFQQSDKQLSAADCIQLLVYHELNGTLAEEARNIAIINTVESGDETLFGSVPRLEHTRVVRCYRDRHMTRPMNLTQNRAIQALLKVWDQHTEWNDERWLAYVIGTAAYETNDFLIKEESLSFASASRLKVVWPTKFPTEEAAQRYVKNPEGLADVVYGGQMGNTEPGDGWRYHGRGFTEIRGRINYRHYGELIGAELEEYPDLAIAPSIGARLAFAQFIPSGAFNFLARYFNRDTEDWISPRSVVSRRSIGALQVANKSKAFLECIKEAHLN